MGRQSAKYFGIFRVHYNPSNGSLYSPTDCIKVLEPMIFTAHLTFLYYALVSSLSSFVTSLCEASFNFYVYLL